MAGIKDVTFTILLGLFVPSYFQKHGPADYCENEKFDVQCDKHEEILIQSAMYGRMKAGRCIDNHGIGCSMDVLPVMDDMCSGKDNCFIPLVGQALIAAKFKADVCPRLTAYLEASYNCVEVLHGRGSCNGESVIRTATEGFISSRISSDTNFGSPNCPWKLKLSGKIFNITLYKFPKQSDDSLLAPSSSLCYEIGRIKEGREEKNMMVCGTDSRHKVIYLSQGGDIEISFTEKAVLETLGRFILSYKASSCVIPKAPANGHVSRRRNIISINCNNSDTKWEVKCSEVEQWSAENHKCPDVDKWNIDDILSHDEISVGIVLVVAMGLTVFICALGFILYLLYHYCKRCRENAAHERAVNTRDYTDEEKKGTENLIKFPPENENVKYRENTLRSNAGSSDTSSLDKRTISWPIRESFRHSSHADTLQFPDEHESESVSVEDETINSHVASEEVAIDCPDYGLPRK